MDHDNQIFITKSKKAVENTQENIIDKRNLIETQKTMKSLSRDESVILHPAQRL